MKDKKVFVSGASRGIGKSIAEYFLMNNYIVIGTSRSDSNIDKDYKNYHHFSLDITSRIDIKNLHQSLENNDLLPDILINNAGITDDKLFLKMSDENWDNVINTNLTGTFNLTKVFIKNMIKKRYGRIINISSVSGLMGNPGQVNYSSSKSALNGFTKSLAKELGSRNITVNSVAPGFISTDMTTFLDDNKKNEIIRDIPLKRFGKSEDVSQLVYFLASDNSSYITGQTISVDGGLLMH